MLGLCEITSCRRRRCSTILASAQPCGNCILSGAAETWDGTEAARKALSAAFPEQRFGVNPYDVRVPTATKFSSLGISTCRSTALVKDGQQSWRSVFRRLWLRAT